MSLNWLFFSLTLLFTSNFLVCYYFKRIVQIIIASKSYFKYCLMLELVLVVVFFFFCYWYKSEYNYIYKFQMCVCMCVRYLFHTL